MGEQTNHDEEAKIEGIPLTVDESLAILDKWTTHPGLLTALFDAGQLAAAEVRRLRDKVKQLEADNEHLQRICDTLVEDLTASVKAKPPVQDVRERLKFSSN
jgi:hypothetical protein